MNVMQSYTESTDLVMDGTALAERLAQDGYLFIRGLVPTDAVENVGRQFLDVVAQGGWLDPDHPKRSRIANRNIVCADPEPEFLQVFRRFYLSEDSHALKHHPNIVGLFERIFDEEVLVHPLFVARNIFPQKEKLTTRPHQDFVHIQGTAETFTVWLPLHDCPREMGGLAVAEGSHRQGVHDFTVASGAGGLEVTAPFDGQWRFGDFAVGDALIFHSMMVHKGMDNKTKKIRHSIDARYQRVSEPISEVSMANYSGCGDWEEIYNNWETDDLKYYWRKQNPDVQPYDFQYYDRRDDIAFKMAEDGNDTARAALLRIVQRDPRAEKRARATDLLDRLEA